MLPRRDVRRSHGDHPPPRARLELLLSLAALALAACGGAEPATPVADVPDAGADVTLDAPAFDIPVDRADAGPECATDADCADGVGCTLDACRAGRCEHAPQTALCGPDSTCDPLQGCRARRRCTTDAQCVDADPCSLRERCDGVFCVADELPLNTPCGAAGSGRVCSAGVCQCPMARPDVCDGRCVDLRTDPARCGACDVACGAGSWCDGGRCACASPQTYCAAVGCVDARVDPMNCGACGQRCEAPARCEDGRCRAPCPTGSHRCGDACAPDSAAATCGSRCEPCSAPAGATPACTLAAGSYACDFTCPAGTHRCGATCARDDQLATCGSRCSPCPAPANGTVACVAGACVVTCAAGAHRCGDSCVRDDLPASCGSRCDPCPVPDHSVATCASGTCDFTCATGYRRCGEVCSDGNDPLGCGPACVRCPAPTNGRATCAAGACGFTCNGGTHACGAVCARDDLPETCGSRCAPCPVPANARATCEGGACGWECLGGFVRAGDRCRALPRPLWPPSGSMVANRRPAMRWSIPDDADPTAADTVVEFCADRGCAAPTMTLPAGTGRGAPAMDLPRGVVWWRVRAGGLSSASWPMVVGGPENALSPRPTAAFGAVPDFNGDGFGDTVFGAPFASPPIVLQYPGARGGVGLLPPEAINAPDPSLRFGASLAAGDFNGDGRIDLAVGAPTVTGSASRGAVYVFFAGTAGVGTGPDVTLDDPVGGVSAYAEVVVAAGDLDADGYGDLAVGSSRARNQGAVYVYRGTATGPSSTPSWTLSGPAMNLALFGGALAAGDLDADGDSDLVVGASGVADFTGRAYVYSGSPTGLPAVATLTLQRAEGGQFGAAVAVPGDLDGDGYADLAVGAPAVDDGTGIVLAYRGGAAGVAVTTAVLRRGEAPRGDFGGALASAGDMNNDGRYDLLVGAGRLNDFTGRAYLLRGDGVDALGLGATAIAGPMVAAAYFGGVLGAGRDIDGDGFDDVLISAERNRSFAGGAFVYYGSVAGVGRSTEIPSAIMGGRFGYALAARACVRPLWM